ncbi:MAG: PaaI family thioesterase [Thermosulfidibacteraceae bacterium]|jgi:uncharacterized protein (TIGR00369 family)
MEERILKLPHYKTCFGCGLENPIGLKLERYWDKNEKKVFANFKLDRFYNGFENIAHGGILAVIADEVLWWSVFMTTKKVTVTYKLDLTFLKPIIVGENYAAVARVSDEKGKRIMAEAEIVDNNATTYLKAQGLFVEIKEKESQKFLKDYEYLFNK